MLFEMLSALRLYREPSVELTAGRILREPPPSISDHRRDVPAELEELLFELLAKSPDSRPSTAKEVSDRLEQIERELSDAVSLEDFVNERFGEEQEVVAGRIARALEVVTPPAEAISVSEVALPQVEAAAPGGSRPLPQAPRGWRRLPLLFVFGAALLSAVAAWAWVESRAAEPVTAEAPEVPEAAPVDLPSLPSAPPVPVLAPDVESTAQSMAAVSEPDPTPTKRATMRRAMGSTMRIVTRPGEGGWH